MGEGEQEVRHLVSGWGSPGRPWPSPHSSLLLGACGRARRTPPASFVLLHKLEASVCGVALRFVSGMLLSPSARSWALAPAPSLVEVSSWARCSPGQPGGAALRKPARPPGRPCCAGARRCGAAEGCLELPPASDVGMLLLIEVSKVHGCPGMLEQQRRRTAGFRGERSTAPPQVAAAPAPACVLVSGRSSSPLCPLLYSPRRSPCGRSAWAGSGLPRRRGSGRLTGVSLCVRVCAYASAYI